MLLSPATFRRKVRRCFTLVALVRVIEKGRPPTGPPPPTMGDTEFEFVTSAMSTLRSNRLS